MENLFVVLTAVCSLITLVVCLITKSKQTDLSPLNYKLDELSKNILRIEQVIKEDLRLAREENNQYAKDNRKELGEHIKRA